MPEERREQVTRVGIEQGQRVTGGTRRFRWKAAAFHGWHEPDKSRGLRPESVSGSGCKSPGRLGLGVKFPGPTRQTVEVVLSEYGPDLSRFPTEKEFVAHVTLAPRVPSSGGRPLKKKKRNTPARGWRLPCAWQRFRCDTARPPWEPTIASSPNGWAEMLRCSLPPGSWPR